MKSTRTLKLLALASPITLLLGACAGQPHVADSATSTDLPEAAAPEAAAPELTAESIIQRYVRQTNTDGMVAETTSTHVVGSIELAAMGLKGDMEIHAAKPNKFLLRSTMGPAGTTMVGYDGEIGWMSNPMMGTSVLEGVELLALVIQADYRAALMDPTDYDVVELEGQEEFEGRNCHRIKMVYRAPEDPELAEESLKTRTSIRWFDVETGMMLGMLGTQSSPQGEMDVTTTFDVYEELGGYTFPVRSTQKVMGMEVTITVDETEVNTVEASVFDLPEDVRALLD